MAYDVPSKRFLHPHPPHQPLWVVHVVFDAEGAGLNFHGREVPLDYLSLKSAGLL